MKKLSRVILFTSLLSSLQMMTAPLRADVTSSLTAPAGSSGQVQFNDRKRFGADSTFTYSTMTKTVTVSTITASKMNVSTISALAQVNFQDGTTMTTAATGGGGGASTLQVFNNFDGTRSSPTASISLSDAFRGSVTGSTYTFRVNFSSVASVSDLANYLPLTSTPTFLSTITAASTYLSQSSASATYFPLISSTTLLTTSSAAATYQPLDSTLSDLANAPLGEDNSVSTDALAAGTLPTDVMASSNTRNITSGQMANSDHGDVSWTGGVATVDNVAAANVAAGALGASVRTSSVAVNGFFSADSVRSNLGLAIGTNVQAYDADLDDLADGSLTGSKVGDGVPAANIAAGTLDTDVKVSSISVPAFFSANSVRTNLGLAIGSDVQAYDADLDDLADGSLTGSKVGSGVPAANIASGDLGSSVKASSFPATGVTAGSYTNTNLTVDAQGRITAASNGSAGGGGGASALEVFSNVDATRSSPTASIGVGGGLLSSVSGSTFTFQVNWSSGISRSDVGAGYQPLDSTLTDLAAAPLGEDNSIAVGAIAAGSLPTDVIASSLSASGFFSDATVRSNLGLAIGTNVQAYDADLDDLADGSLTGSKVGDGVPAANIAAGQLDTDVRASSAALVLFYSDNSVRTNLGLAIGTNVQAYDADLDDLADGSLTGSKVGSGVPAANIASGSLGSSVIASSVAVNAVGADQILADGVSASELNATGVEAELEAVLDLNEMQGQITASQLPSAIPSSVLPSTVAYTNQSSTDSFSFSISSAGWNSLVFPGHSLDAVEGSTVTMVLAETMPVGSTITFSLQYRALGSLNSAGTDMFTVVYSTANSDGKTITGITNSLVPAKASVNIVTPASASAGSATHLRVTVFYKRRDR